MSNKESFYNLLYIEDEREVRRNYVDYLERFFKNIYEASNAEDALEIYKSKKPDILIIDINLPGKSGIDFLRELRKNDHTTKAIMLTANSDIQTLLNATELKLTKYLIKPVSRSDLREAISLAEEELLNYTILSNKIIKIKDSFCWDQENRKLFSIEEELFLTKKEIELLTLLFSNITKVFSIEDIILELWYHSDEDRRASLKTLIKSLRKKLPKDTIKNIFGVGYTIEV